LTLPPQPRGFGVAFRLTLVTSDPSLAAAADRSDVDYVGVDLDVIGKAARQSDKDSRLSDHKPEDLAIIGASVTRAKLFARVNPINPQTPFEIENVLRRGAQAIMLPYFRTVEEVAEFVRMVGNRAQISIPSRRPRQR
jgi:HpcH/HpaI aldolase/citrate lyase family.